MRKQKVFLVRAVRKSSHIAKKASYKVGHFSQRVEGKTTRMLLGTDSSFGAVTNVPFEEIYYSKLPYITPLHPSLPLLGRKPAVVLLLPSLDKSSFFGGTSTAIFAAAVLANEKGLDLRVVQTLKRGEADVAIFLKKSGITFAGNISIVDVSARSYNVYGYIDMHPDDIFMASAWWDAYLLDRLPMKKKYIYLIQDFEPIFYSNSDLYVQAESTYHSDKFVALCNTKLMYDFMLNRNYHSVKNGVWFEPAVSYITTHNKSHRPNAKRRIFLYGRPNVERNLFFTAISSLDMCFAREYLGPSDWEIFMAGQDNLPDIELTSGVVIKSMGKMEFEDYQKLLKTVDVAVSLMMAPHPNYPTLEFAASGAAVVTTRYDIKQDLSSYSKNVIMADITPESISGAIKHAASLSSKIRIENADQSNIQSSWENALSDPLKRVAGLL